MGFELLTEADYVLDACGREVPPPGYRFVDLPRVIPFHSAVRATLGTGTLCGSMSGPSVFPEEVTANGEWSQDNTTNNVGPVGPFADSGSRRFELLFDDSTNKVRAFFSADVGASWAEVDAANAPDAATDGGSPAPSLYLYFGVVQDSGRNLFLVFWDTDFTISLKSFSMATGTWGATVKSVLGYLSTSLPVSDNTGFGVAYRASDNSVWMMFAAGLTAAGTIPNRVRGARCDLSSSTWDLALTNLSTADDTDLHDWQVAGMTGPDSAGDLHLFFVAYSNVAFLPLPPFTNTIYHRVLHADNSLGALGVVASTTSVASSLKFTRVGYPYLCLPACSFSRTSSPSMAAALRFASFVA